MRYLIIGGTGTLGRTLLERLYSDHEIHIFSRDELKQSQLKKVYPNIKCILGDIRAFDDLDFDFSIYQAVFLCAALKHVDIGESNVNQFIKTNLLGAINVSKKCVAGNTRLVFFTTDKAVLPINAYGMSKSLAEKYIQSENPNHVIFRWGNILGSRGSVLSYFANIIKNDGKVPITHLGMTRFWLTINEVVDFVIDNFSKDNVTKTLMPKVRASTVTDLALAIGKCLNKTVKFKEVGIRPGEKIHEHLESNHDYCIRSNNCKQYTMQELVDKIKPILGEL